MIKIALVGNPNCGKTTVFNELTGLNQSVGNWPGVTVEKKSGKLIYLDFEAQIVDLPGIYSLSTISLEEEIASLYVQNMKMDLIVNIVDASNLERNLFLTYQLLDTKIPMIVVLNCMDIVERKLDNINIKELENKIGVPVIPITASKKHGINELKLFISKLNVSQIKQSQRYSQTIEESITEFEKILKDRFLAIRFFEDDFKGIEKQNLSIMEVEELKRKRILEIQKYDIDFDMVLPNYRYNQITNVCSKVLIKGDVSKTSVTDKIDRILTNKWLGLPLFALIMLLVFFLAFGPIGTFITNQFVWLMNQFFVLINRVVVSFGMATWVSSLLTNGIFGGLAAVVGFLPQLTILFLFLAILEDSGYMSRAAFIMDRALKKFGLSGKSFIPMLIGFGCSVPAVASTRTLDKAEDRKITTMIIPFISCGAKAPIYGVFAGALFFGASYLVVFSMYFLGIIVAILSAILFKKTILKGASANYIMELPEYRMPTLKNTWLHTWERAKGFLIKAGTILLGAFIIIWFMSYFGFVDGIFRLLDQSEMQYSILGIIGKFLLPLFKPLGFMDWQATVAILTGFVAKESVVGTLGILYGVSGNVIENGTLLYGNIQAAFSPLQAYSFMAFALLATPCIAAVSAMKRELGSWKWLTFAILYELVIAYLVSLSIYQIGSLGLGTALSILFGIGVFSIVIYSIKRFISQNGKACVNCSSCKIKNSCNLPKNEKSNIK
ncbi:MAG: ferrous iron transport protein B [Firmicutes bacterium]|nr:ferrous iron transport protein B [Bacillota bacterium]